MPKISVIIPVYKVEQTLNRCVDSVLAQRFADYEIILVNDGSPDRSGEICNAYAREHDKIKVIHKENGGLSDARNAGLAEARGEYVMFLDSDDYLSDDCFEILCAGNADLIIGTIVTVHKDGKLIHQPQREDRLIRRGEFHDLVPALFDERRLNYVHAKLYGMSLIKEHDIRFEDDMLTSAEDTVFNFTFLSYCESIMVFGRPVHFYVYYDSGLARRFYPDRYERYKRLIRHIEGVCGQLDINSGEMKAVIDKRRVQAAVWTMEGILAQVNLPLEERARYLDEIASDGELKAIIGSVDVGGTDDLLYLLKHGGKRLIYNKYLKSYKAKILRGLKRK